MQEYNLQLFQKLALNTLSPLSEEKNYFHMLSGFITEMGELIDPYKKNMAYGKEIDFINVQEEWADAGWYLACWCFMLAEKEKFPTDELFSEENINASLMDFNIDFPIDPEVDKMEYMTKLYIQVLNFTIETETLDYLLCYWWNLGDILGIDKYTTLKRNNLKLAKRYGEKFNAHKAIIRDLEAEREILEGKQD